MDFFKILNGGVGLGMSNFDRLFAEKHGGEDWQLTTLTGALPLSFKSKGTPLTDYKLYGTSEGAGVETENLFDINNRQSSEGFWNNTGGFVLQAGWYGTTLIGVEPNTKYSFNPNSTAGASAKHLFYDENRDMIGYISSGKQTFTTPDNCVMMRFSYRSSSSNIMLVKGSTVPATYIPYGYKLPMTMKSGEESTTTPIYIGDSKLMAEEYVDYESRKVYRDIDGVLTPTDPPVALPELSTYQGENMLSCSEGLGEVSITGHIKGE